MKILCTIAAFLVSMAYAQTDPPNTANRGKAPSAQTFLKRASAGNQAEIKMGELAQHNASSSLVKQDGERMITDHTKMGDQLKGLASKMNVTLPETLSAADQAEYEALSQKTGAAFDRMYVEAMIRDHKTDIAMFEREANTTRNADIKALIENGLPVIREHLQLWESAAKQLGYPTTSTSGGMR